MSAVTGKKQEKKVHGKKQEKAREKTHNELTAAWKKAMSAMVGHLLTVHQNRDLTSRGLPDCAVCQKLSKDETHTIDALDLFNSSKNTSKRD